MAAEDNLLAAPGTHSRELPPCSRVHKVSEITCLSCMAAQQGLNCWDVPVSPCCKRDRSQCHTCTVYAAVRKAGTCVHPVTICLKDGGCLRGQVHVPVGERVSDYLNNSATFLTVTEVQWTEGHPASEGPSPPVIFIATNHIAWVEPTEEAA